MLELFYNNFEWKCHVKVLSLLVIVYSTFIRTKYRLRVAHTSQGTCLWSQVLLCLSKTLNSLSHSDTSSFLGLYCSYNEIIRSVFCCIRSQISEMSRLAFIRTPKASLGYFSLSQASPTFHKI